MTLNRDDLAAGSVFLGIGLFFGGHTLLNLPVGSASDMGPGFFPLALCSILAVLGAAILIPANGRSSEGTADPGTVRRPINLRAVVLISAAPIAFGLVLRSLGLVPALVIALGLALAASRLIGILRGSAILVGMTAFCVGVFYYGLGVPVELLNPALFR